MNIEITNLPGDVVYCKIWTGTILRVIVGRITQVNILINNDKEMHTYTVQTSENLMSFPQGSVTLERKRAMKWIEENLETQLDAYRPVKKVDSDFMPVS